MARNAWLNASIQGLARFSRLICNSNFFNFFNYIALISHSTRPNSLLYLAPVPLTISATSSPTQSPPTPPKRALQTPGHYETTSPCILSNHSIQVSKTCPVTPLSSLLLRYSAYSSTFPYSKRSLSTLTSTPRCNSQILPNFQITAPGSLQIGKSSGLT